MDRKLVRITFAAIAINFFLWNVLMPALEPADESGHYAHILYIWKQGRLPNLVEPVPIEKGVGYTTYSPLYYFSLIPLAKLVDAPLESEELLPYHPRKELFKKSVFAVYLHTKEELFFKWNRLASAVHLLRLQTSVYGLLTVYLIYLTGKKLFGEKSLKPLAAAAIVGLNPMFAHISNSIVNVNLGILLFSLFFYLSVRSFEDLTIEKLATLNIALGIIAGLAYLTKITGLVLIPIWFLFTVISTKTILKDSRDFTLFLIQSLGLFLLGFLVTAGWYLVRNLKLYGSLLEAEAAIKHFGRPAAQLEISGPINYWIGFIQTNFKTFFSGYGMVTVNLPDTIIYVLAVMIVMGFWGILVRAGQAMTRREFFLAVAAFLILAAHVAVNFSVEAFHARDLFTGMVPFSLLFVLGMETWLVTVTTGRLWDFQLINLLMAVLVYVLTIFHFQQQALVSIIKSAVDGRQIALEPVLSTAAVTTIFVLGWRFFLLKIKDFCIGVAGFLDVTPARSFHSPYLHLKRGSWSDPRRAQRNDGRKMIQGLTVGLFASNVAILFILVIPRLYQL